MSALPLETWIRFVIWLLLGLIIYFAYGRKHSELQKANAPIYTKMLTWVNEHHIKFPRHKEKK